MLEACDGASAFVPTTVSMPLKTTTTTQPQTPTTPTTHLRVETPWLGLVFRATSAENRDEWLRTLTGLRDDANRPGAHVHRRRYSDMDVIDRPKPTLPQSQSQAAPSTLRTFAATTSSSSSKPLRRSSSAGPPARDSPLANVARKAIATAARRTRSRDDDASLPSSRGGLNHGKQPARPPPCRA